MIRTIKPTGGGGGGSTPVATELVQGKAQIATSAQTTTGTEAGAYFVTPLRLQDKVDAALVGGVEYKGGYNNTTALPNLTTAKKGDLYIITNKGAGTLAGVAIEVSDHIVFNQDSANPLTSAYFDVIVSSDAVQSVNAATGVVVLDTDDITEGSSNLYYTDTRADGRIGAASIGDLSNVASTVPTNLDVLTWDTVGSTWKPVASSGGGGGARPVVNVDSSATITVTAPASSILEIIYLCSATTGTQTVDLHTAVGHAGLKYNIKRTGTVNVTVDPNGAETIDGVATFVLTTQYDSVTICSDGTNWVIL